MDKLKWSDALPEGEDQGDPMTTAESVRTDFDRLIAVFDHRLASLPDVDGEVRSHLLEAKAAAERGRKLSQQLIKLMR